MIQSLQDCRKCGVGPAGVSPKTTSAILAWPFARWLRYSLLTDPLAGYARRLRLASGQNSCAIITEFIFAQSLGQNLVLSSTFFLSAVRFNVEFDCLGLFRTLHVENGQVHDSGRCQMCVMIGLKSGEKLPIVVETGSQVRPSY